MKNFRYKNLLLVLTLVLFLFLGTTNFASAQIFSLGSISLKALSFSQSFIIYVIAYLAGWAVQLGGTLSNWALDLNSNILQSETVRVGWVISRDIANLGFVLAIILISFATILRFENYQMKKTLLNLIIAALLVNFSLVFAGVFIDFAGVLTNFFISKATAGSSLEYSGRLGAALAGAFQVQKLLQPPSNQTLDTLPGLFTDFNKAIVFIASLFFAAGFTLIAAISLLGLAAMLFIRYIWLNILLVMMPIAWLLWIWPDTQKFWTQWWGKFFQWVWFAPAASFFIYLALAIAEKKSVTIAGAEQFLNPGNNLGIINADAAGIIGQMISVGGILIGGLMAANSMGITGSEASLKAANGVKNWILGAPGKAGGAAGRALIDRLRTVGYKSPDAEGKGGGGLIQRTAARLAGNRLVGGVARTVGGWAASGGKELVTDYEKEYQKLAEDKNAFLNASDSPAIKSDFLRNPAKAAAYINTAAEKGMLNDLQKKSPDLFNSLITASKQMGTANKIFSKNPTLAGIGLRGAEKIKEIKKWAVRTSPSDKINLAAEGIFDEKASSDPDYHPTILLTMTKPDLKKFALEGKGGQIEAINKGRAYIQKMIDDGKLTLDESEKRSFEILKSWDDDNPVAQVARAESKLVDQYGRPIKSTA